MEEKCAVRIATLKEIQEDVLAENLKKIKADYWNGVKAVENGIYGSFQMHNGKRVKPLWIAFFWIRNNLF